jgi:hypothetical protein
MTASLDDAPDIAILAARLTPAQRRAVLRGRPENELGNRGRGYWSLTNALIDKGLLHRAGYRYVLTPIGQQLQASLKVQA